MTFLANFARRTGTRKLILGMAALAALTACAPTARGPSTVSGSGVPVALLVPGGSGQASEEQLAQSLENAARLAVNDLGAGSIDLHVYDTAANPTQAANVTAQALAEGARIIVGPLHAQDANAAGNAASGAGINVLSFSNNAEIAGGNVFILGQTFQNTADRLLGYAASIGKRSVFIVYDPDTAGQIGRNAIQSAASSNGLSVIGTETYEFSQQGLTAAAPRIASAITGSGADLVFFTASTAGALPMLTQLLRDNGVDPRVTTFMGLTRWDVPSGAVSTPSLQGGIFAQPDPAITQQFNSRYSAAYGTAPHPLAALAYDGIAAVGALTRSGRGDGLTASALTQGSGFVGANGVFRLFPNGTNERGLAISQIRDNQVQVIQNAPQSFGGAGF